MDLSENSVCHALHHVDRPRCNQLQGKKPLRLIQDAVAEHELLFCAEIGFCICLRG